MLPYREGVNFCPADEPATDGKLKRRGELGLRSGIVVRGDDYLSGSVRTGANR
jgi:hypothetical protein